MKDTKSIADLQEAVRQAEAKYQQAEALWWAKGKPASEADKRLMLTLEAAERDRQATPSWMPEPWSPVDDEERLMQELGTGLSALERHFKLRKRADVLMKKWLWSSTRLAVAQERLQRAVVEDAGPREGR